MTAGPMYGKTCSTAGLLISGLVAWICLSAPSVDCCKHQFDRHCIALKLSSTL